MFGNNCSCAYKSIFAYIMATDYSSIGPNSSSLFYYRSSILVFAIYGTAWVNYIGKYHRGPQEHIVLANYARIYRYIILHLNIIAQHHTRRYHYILSNIAIFAKGTIGHNVAKVPYFGSFANLAAGIYYCCRMYSN